jgi:hypothetical protein
MNRKGNAMAIIAMLVLVTAVPLAGAKVTANQSLGSGWNLVGLPQNSEPIAPADFISGLEGVVVMWSADENLMFDPAMPDSVNTLQVLEPGRAFWIYINNPEKQNKTLDVLEVSEVKLTLHPGENNIFTPFYMADILCSKFSQDIKGVRTIHAYNPEKGWLLYDPAMPEFLDDFWSIQAGTAYRVYVEYPTDQVINVQVENPKVIVPEPEVNESVPIVYHLSDVSEQSGMAEVFVNLTSKLEEPIASIVFDLSFNHSVLNLTAVENGNLNNGWANPRFDSDGKVLLFYHGNGTELTGNLSGTVATLKFRIEDPEMGSSINMSSMQIGNVAFDFGSVAVGINTTFRG